MTSGWWFGTFFMFPYIGNNHPTLCSNQHVWALQQASRATESPALRLEVVSESTTHSQLSLYSAQIFMYIHVAFSKFPSLCRTAYPLVSVALWGLISTSNMTAWREAFPLKMPWRRVGDPTPKKVVSLEIQRPLHLLYIWLYIRIITHIYI